LAGTRASTASLRLRLSNYTPAEIKALIESYAELREEKDTNPRGLRVLVMLADLERAIAHMPPKEYHAVLLHGLLGETVRDAETYLGVSKSTLLDRYHAGVAWITDYLNNGGETT
jgi:DNA-directed RNA polymerase specialized sigma24 family protein